MDGYKTKCEFRFSIPEFTLATVNGNSLVYNSGRDTLVYIYKKKNQMG